MCACVQPSYCVWLVYRVGRLSQVTVSSTKPDRCPYQSQLKSEPIINGCVCECTHPNTHTCTHTHHRDQHEDRHQKIRLPTAQTLKLEDRLCPVLICICFAHLQQSATFHKTELLNHIMSQKPMFPQNKKRLTTERNEIMTLYNMKLGILSQIYVIWLEHR